MAKRRAHITAVGAALAVCLVASSCSSNDGFGEVSAGGEKAGGSLETSTTMPSDGRLPASRRSSSSGLKGSGDLLSQLQNNPELAAQLANMTPEQLAELTGLSIEQLNTLGITPASVAALGSALITGQGTANALIGPESSPAVNALLGAVTNDLTTDTRATLQNLDPAVLATILGSAVDVDPALLAPLGGLLKVIDPNGLGQFADDQSSLAVISVVLGASLGRNPLALENLENLDQIDPQYKAVLAGIAGLVDKLTPQAIYEINNIVGILGPNVIAAMGAALTLLRRPAVGEVVKAAVNDPLTLASSLGAALILIPGLAELVAPNTFTSPTSRITALGALFVVSLIRMRTPGVLEFLTALGVEIPPEILEQM